MKHKEKLFRTPDMNRTTVGYLCIIIGIFSFLLFLWLVVGFIMMLKTFLYLLAIALVVIGLILLL